MCFARRSSSMRASPGAGPQATITSSRAASQHEAETGSAEAEDGGDTRKTPCPMLRRFRISAGRDACESMEAAYFAIWGSWTMIKNGLVSGIVGVWWSAQAGRV